MSFASSDNNRVVSGMRPTGDLHLGHYHGVLKNWVSLQHEYECFFFVADLHALTTHYEKPYNMSSIVIDIIIDWLAVGLNPSSCCIFVQSQVPEHAELHLLLSMLSPLGWLERIPSYKEQQEKLKDKDLTTYGFLGYPVLQSADVLLYKAKYVPVGEDQVAHIELIRELARRFNHIYGREIDFEKKVEEAILKMGKKNATLYRQALKNYQEHGDHSALQNGWALLLEQSNLSIADRDRLHGYLEGSGKTILTEPEALLTKASRVVGIDGQKMSKSYGNTIKLRDEPEEIERKLLIMKTDPARVRRGDCGDPDKCPVWELHKIYSTSETMKWVWDGCTKAGIGCIDCKKSLSTAVIADQEPILAAIKELKDNVRMVKEIIRNGCEKARDTASDSMDEIREAMGLIRDL